MATQTPQSNDSVSIRGPAAAVAAVMARLNSPASVRRNSVPDPDAATIVTPPAVNTPPSTPPPAGGQACTSCAGGATGSTNPTGALAGQSNCLTTGAQPAYCAPGTFSAYTAQFPFFLTNTPTRRDFDVPCAVALEYYARVATLCASEISIMTTIEVGNGGSGCCTTAVTASVTGNTAHIVMSAEAGCEVFTPGILFTIGFSQNTAPGPVELSVSAIGSDGCAVVSNNIRGLMQQLGSGELAFLFNCVEEQRLYPVIASLRTDVPLLPSGTILPGVGTLTAPVNYPNRTIAIDVSGPAGMVLTSETLTWNHPTLSCLWNRALQPLGF